MLGLVLLISSFEGLAQLLTFPEGGCKEEANGLFFAFGGKSISHGGILYELVRLSRGTTRRPFNAFWMNNLHLPFTTS